jgi:hypothetical protein
MFPLPDAEHGQLAREPGVWQVADVEREVAELKASGVLS